MAQEIKKVAPEAFGETVKSGVTLVDFYADWCGPCRMLSPVLQEVAAHMKDKASVIKIDIDDATAVTEKYEIASVPTLILFKDGKEVDRVVGLRDADFLKGFVEAQC